MNHSIWLRAVTVALVLMANISAVRAATSSLTLCCPPDHELYHLLQKNDIPCGRTDTFAQAVEQAAPDSGVLYLATGYPTKPTPVDEAALQSATNKRLRLYLEFPATLPGHTLDSITTTAWERAIVTSDSLSPHLAPMRILSVSGCHYLPTQSSHTLLAIGRVAGYDTAVFGLPTSAHPLLFEAPDLNALIATTCLSTFQSGRYGPARDWELLWESLVTRLNGSPVGKLRHQPSVHPAYAAAGSLPADAEPEAVKAAAQWLLKSRLLVSDSREPIIRELLLAKKEDTPVPDADDPTADGSNGILEGYSSHIGWDGDQPQRIPLRADCQTESAMLLAAAADLADDIRTSSVARNLLNFTFGPKGFTQGIRADPKHPSYGLIAWGIISPAWEVGNYGDDNARAILASLAAAALLGESQWDEQVLRAIAANFRTTGIKGFRNDRIDNPELEKHGWQYFRDRDIVNLAPHFESWLWACYLVAWKQTGYEPFRELARKGLTTTMEAYPQGWRWNDNMERARMLLPLAWLARVDDTPKHREWVERVARDLLAHVDETGAIPDRLGGSGGGHYQVPQSNESFGVGESPLIQNNGDPVSDQLYTSGFALLGLEEAAAVTGSAELEQHADKLADYLCRIQVRSEPRPYLDGTWLRAFDFKRWDYWASSGDIGWGPWCAETGWGHTWTGTAMALRLKNQTLWDLLNSRPLTNWDKVRDEMLTD